MGRLIYEPENCAHSLLFRFSTTYLFLISYSDFLFLPTPSSQPPPHSATTLKNSANAPARRGIYKESNTNAIIIHVCSVNWQNKKIKTFIFLLRLCMSLDFGPTSCFLSPLSTFWPTYMNRGANLLSKEAGDVLLTVLQVTTAVQSGVGHQQESPLHLGSNRETEENPQKFQCGGVQRSGVTVQLWLGW